MQHLAGNGIGAGIGGQLTNEGMVPIEILESAVVSGEVVVPEAFGDGVELHGAACNRRAEMEIPWERELE